MPEDIVIEAGNEPIHNFHNEHEKMGFYEINDTYKEKDIADAWRHQNAQFILKTKELSGGVCI